MHNIQGTTPAGNKPRVLSLWIGENEPEPRLHLLIHLPSDTNGWEIRVRRDELIQELEGLKAEKNQAPARPRSEPTSIITPPGSGTGLVKFFQRPLSRTALERYRLFTDEKRWTISHKFELYQQAQCAFASDLPKEQKVEAFRSIYENLRGSWQVFRNARSYLGPEEIFDKLSSQGSACKGGSGFTLPQLLPVQLRETIYPFLEIMKDIKRNRLGSFPTMAVSKFLHFFNPSLFPIYDNAFIRNEVLKVFNEDFLECGQKAGFGEEIEDEDYYGPYMHWASELIRLGGDEFMNDFAEWFSRQVHGKEDQEGILTQAPRYYATAFEFVAIGAAKLVQDNT